MEILCRIKFVWVTWYKFLHLSRNIVWDLPLLLCPEINVCSLNRLFFVAQSQPSEFFTVHESLRSGARVAAPSHCVFWIYSKMLRHSSAGNQKQVALALPSQEAHVGSRKQGGIWWGDSGALFPRNTGVPLVGTAPLWNTDVDEGFSGLGDHFPLFHSFKSSSQISGCVGRLARKCPRIHATSWPPGDARCSAQSSAQSAHQEGSVGKR